MSKRKKIQPGTWVKVMGHLIDAPDFIGYVLGEFKSKTIRYHPGHAHYVIWEPFSNAIVLTCERLIAESYDEAPEELPRSAVECTPKLQKSSFFSRN